MGSKLLGLKKLAEMESSLEKKDTSLDRDNPVCPGYNLCASEIGLAGGQYHTAVIKLGLDISGLFSLPS